MTPVITIANNFITGMVPFTVHLDVVQTVLPPGNTWQNVKFKANFGDTTGQSRFNEIGPCRQYEFAHTYETANDYTITVTGYDKDGNAVSATVGIHALPDTRTPIYVDPVGGNDANNGLTSGSPIKTLAHLQSLWGDNKHIFIKGGTELPIGTTQWLITTGKNVVFSSYGTGQAWISNSFTATNQGAASIVLRAATENITFQNIKVGSTIPNPATMTLAAWAKTNIGTFLSTSGKNHAVLDCTAVNVCDFVNNAGNAIGVMLLGNNSPTVYTLRGYFGWIGDGAGQYFCAMANVVPNSVVEHCFRGHPDKCLMYRNTLANVGGNITGILGEISKACIFLMGSDHTGLIGGKFAGAYWNTIGEGGGTVNALGFGPLPGSSIFPNETAHNYSIERNDCTEGGIGCAIGMHDAWVGENILNGMHYGSASTIYLLGYDPAGNRYSTNVIIEKNTIYNSAVNCVGLKNGDNNRDSGQQGIVWKDNLVITNNATVGNLGSAVETHYGTNTDHLASFAYIGGNVYSTSPAMATAGPMMVTPLSPNNSNRLTGAQWNALAKVNGRDQFFTNLANTTPQHGGGATR